MTQFYKTPLVLFAALALAACGGGSSNSSGSSSSGAAPNKALNDTGIITCGTADNTSNRVDCDDAEATKTEDGEFDSAVVPAGQDAHFGRDALVKKGKLTKVGYGPASFDYTKLDENGNSLPKEATEWSCVRDNVTGLIWEVKTQAGTGGLHDANNTYTWYSTINNNGNAGTPDGGTCVDSDCDTQAFTQAVNAEALCGFTDWRMPSGEELVQLVHFGRANPTISTDLFPNTRNNYYWSSSPVAYSGSKVWIVDFSLGNENSHGRDNSNYVRLVSAGQ